MGGYSLVSCSGTESSYPFFFPAKRDSYRDGTFVAVVDLHGMSEAGLLSIEVGAPHVSPSPPPPCGGCPGSNKIFAST